MSRRLANAVTNPLRLIDRLRGIYKLQESAGAEPQLFPTTSIETEAADRIEKLEAALRHIIEWSEAYPVSVFPKPTDEYYAKAAKVLEANGMTLDCMSAAIMRHVITEAAKIARGALKWPPAR